VAAVAPHSSAAGLECRTENVHRRREPIRDLADLGDLRSAPAESEGRQAAQHVGNGVLNAISRSRRWCDLRPTTDEGSTSTRSGR
jgi:hypothetical protein